MGPNPRFIEIEIEKSRCLIKKKLDPKLPRNLLCFARSPAVYGSGGAHWCPSKFPTVSKKIEKKMCRNCIWLRFFARKGQKQWQNIGNSVKNYPFSIGNTQNGGVLEKKSGIFVFFWVLGLSGLRILLSYFLAGPITAP